MTNELSEEVAFNSSSFGQGEQGMLPGEKVIFLNATGYQKMQKPNR